MKPTNGDGFVNWLTTHLVNSIGTPATSRCRARIVVHDDREICRVDVAASPRAVPARTSTADAVFYVRLNNSTRSLTADDMQRYVADHWFE